MHINTHTNDSVAVTEYTYSPLLLFLLSRGNIVIAISHRIWFFLSGSLHMPVQIYITYLHQHTYALTQSYVHTGL